jgi:A/G-specific adenine glycosylase
MQNKELARFFQQQLLDWYRPEARPLPWKGIQNPYHIWLSEIILQQTRVEQGRDYYLRFVEAYPRIEDLAAAPDDEVMKLWEGLGYYSRARNLLSAARYVVDELGGAFPTTYTQIRQLKGVGPYTAAAIASFAFNLPHAVVDGNVFRVLSRFFGIATPQDSTEGKKQFAQLAESLLDVNQAARYNQAIMDFGATVCLPRAPKCSQCPLRGACVALHEQRVAELPVKSKKILKSERYFHYFLLNYAGKIFIQKREEKDIWMHLYQFPLWESTHLDLRSDAVKARLSENWHLTTQVRQSSKVFQQVLTHQLVLVRFWELDLNELPEMIPQNWILIPREDLGKYAFPKVIDRYLGDKTLYLDLNT